MENGPESQVEYGPEFEYGGQPVGLFRDGIVPTSDGDYGYEPYRGPGHHDMAMALRSGRVPRCSYAAEGRRIWFDVEACPVYALLSLARFETVADRPGSES